MTKAQQTAVKDMADRYGVSAALFVEWANATRQSFSRIVDGAYGEGRDSVVADFLNWLPA